MYDSDLHSLLSKASSLEQSARITNIDGLRRSIELSHATHLVVDLKTWSMLIPAFPFCADFQPSTAIESVQKGYMGIFHGAKVVTDAFFDLTQRVLPREFIAVVHSEEGKFSGTGLILDLEDASFVSRPTIVCLCGSSRFYTTFQRQFYEEEMKGKIVLTMGFLPDVPDDAHHGMLGITEEQKVMLDKLHHDKIRMADEVLVLNVDGYIGQSTRREIELAHSLSKIVRYLETPLETSTNV